MTIWAMLTNGMQLYVCPTVLYDVRLLRFVCAKITLAVTVVA